MHISFFANAFFFELPWFASRVPGLRFAASRLASRVVPVLCWVVVLRFGSFCVVLSRCAVLRRSRHPNCLLLHEFSTHSTPFRFKLISLPVVDCQMRLNFQHTLFQPISRHFTSVLIISPYFTSFHVVSTHFISFRVISRHLTLFHPISFHFNPFQFM